MTVDSAEDKQSMIRMPRRRTRSHPTAIHSNNYNSPPPSSTPQSVSGLSNSMEIRPVTASCTTATGSSSTSNASSAITCKPQASARVSPSPSRNGGSTGSNPSSSIPRALRILRVLIYSLAAPNFLYSMYVQLIVLKGPGRTPLPASVNFGGDSLFLTFHANFHCAWYFCLCLLHAVLTLGQRRPRSYAARTVEICCHRPTAVLFPLASFVGLAYYLILHFHPLNRLRAQVVPDHDAKMALLHFNPLMFIIFDSWLKDNELLSKHGLKKRRATRAIICYGMLYFAWTALCTRFNGGHWPYPFQKSFSVVQHMVFVVGSAMFAAYLCRAGFRLHGRLDRRRRRRSAAASERAAANNINNNNSNNNCNSGATPGQTTGIITTGTATASVSC